MTDSPGKDDSILPFSLGDYSLFKFANILFEAHDLFGPGIPAKHHDCLELSLTAQFIWLIVNKMLCSTSASSVTRFA